MYYSNWVIISRQYNHVEYANTHCLVQVRLHCKAAKWSYLHKHRRRLTCEPSKTGGGQPLDGVH